MSNTVIDVDADLDGRDYADDIEEILLSGEDDVDNDSIDENSQNTTGSEIKISSVLSGSGVKFGENGVDLCRDEIGIVDNLDSSSILLSPETEGADNLAASCADLSDNSMDQSDNLSETNFSYDSFTDEEDSSTSTERKRRTTLRVQYINLWKAITEGSSKPTCSKMDLLNTAHDLIKKLTFEGRKLEYSTELCLQSNYRLNRRLKKFEKRKRKLSVDSKEGSKPNKVVASRASI